MTWIIKIEFGKSRSSSYNRAIKLARSLPNYQAIDDVNICGALNMKEYLVYHEELEELIYIVERWKSATIYFYDKEYKTLSDFWEYRNRVILHAGKYASILKNENLGKIALEELPLPIVYFPDSYGAFLGFSKDIGEKIYFCECEKEAVENYIRLRKKSPLRNYVGSKTNPLGTDYFPKAISEISKKNPNNPLALFGFKEGLCYRCNKKIPRKLYCQLMYSKGNRFKEIYGWYIQQEYFKLGIDPYQISTKNILIDSCSIEIYDIVKRKEKLSKKILECPDNEDIQEQLKLCEKEFRNAVENLARESIGFKKIGEAWVSETILYNIVKGIFSNTSVIMHFRPKWLKGLELDIFIPEKNIAFEYQGVQHFKPVEYWGGKEQLKKQQEHDRLKKQICEERNIKLIYINYDDDLTEEYIRAKINEYQC